ncbi:hypothetical protein SLEP1_g60291 [Rubroshorea leprosula]|uniref:Uncharacterized protein n=1 Tax=Rubroshorea leprosula TaxID=152421 RepID=A0AAV5MZI3_9ROSI|nr:hypothetical protein SLEP1_g38657 [Rubroshorea leprosula]GKV53777.1 hypothetical protein SLEP1_g60291 [Rubroshorea leprosula]
MWQTSGCHPPIPFYKCSKKSPPFEAGYLFLGSLLSSEVPSN